MAEREEVNFEELAIELGMSGNIPTAEQEKKDPEDESPPGDEKEPELSLEEAFEASLKQEDSKEQDDTTQAGEGESKVESDEDVTKTRGDSPVSDSKPDAKSSDDTQESTTLLFARFLSEQGNLTSFDEEEFKKIVDTDGDEAALSALWNKEAEAIRNNLLDTYDKDVREYLDMLDTGIAPDKAKDISSSRKWLSNITKEDLESDEKEELRKELITRRYKATTKFSDAKIDKLVDRIISLGEDVDEASEAYDELKTYYDEALEGEKEAVKQADKQRQEEADKQLEDFKKKVNDLKEVVPGMELTPKQKQGIIAKLTEPVEEIGGQPVNAIYAKRAKDPFKFDTVLAVLDDIGIFDGKWDKLTKRVKTNTIADLKKKLESETSSRSRAGSYGTGSGEEAVRKNIDSMRGAI